MRVRGYLSTAFGCPYEGAVAAETVAALSARLIDSRRLSKSRSATRSGSRSRRMSRECSRLSSRVCRPRRWRCNFHDTRGHALDNVKAALPFGILTFDASAGGLGGCPYAPGAPGTWRPASWFRCWTGWGSTPGSRAAALDAAAAFIRGRAQAGRKGLHDLFERDHVDGVVVGRAAELALLRRGLVAERSRTGRSRMQRSARTAQHHAAVAIGVLPQCNRDRAGCLANRARERAKTAVGIDDRNRLRGLLRGPDSSWSNVWCDYTWGSGSGLAARDSGLGARPAGD